MHVSSLLKHKRTSICRCFLRWWVLELLFFHVRGVPYLSVSRLSSWKCRSFFFFLFYFCFCFFLRQPSCSCAAWCTSFLIIYIYIYIYIFKGYCDCSSSYTATRVRTHTDTDGGKKKTGSLFFFLLFNLICTLCLKKCVSPPFLFRCRFSSSSFLILSFSVCAIKVIATGFYSLSSVPTPKRTLNEKKKKQLFLYLSLLL